MKDVRVSHFPRMRLDQTWEIVGEPACPVFKVKTDADYYCFLRCQGENHLNAWEATERRRLEREGAITPSLPFFAEH